MSKPTKLALALLLLSCSAFGQTMTRVQGNGAATSGVTSQAVTLSTSTVATGDLILVAGRWGAATGTITATDNNGGCTNTYAHVSGSPNNETVNDNYLMWTRNCGGVSSLTITVSVAGGGSHQLIVGAVEFSSSTGWPSSPVDQTNNNNNTGLNVSGTTGSITTTVTELIYATIEVGTDQSTTSVNSPFSIELAGGTGGYASVVRAWGGEDLNAAAGSYNCTFNWTGTSTKYAAIIASFKPNAAGGAAATMPPLVASKSMKHSHRSGK